jgi:ABC-type polysaccharide/polyol phosphate transport system ATPase subunit
MNVIELKDISKEYNLEATNYKTFFKELSRFFSGKKKNYKHKTILKNINFSIKKGQSVCLLGKNGSGKSTLLKIIAQIAHPNKGIITYKKDCRIASMLSVLTSLEPEFTGYENIFFLGAGMNIDRKILLKIKFF